MKKKRRSEEKFAYCLDGDLDFLLLGLSPVQYRTQTKQVYYVLIYHLLRLVIFSMSLSQPLSISYKNIHLSIYPNAFSKNHFFLRIQNIPPKNKNERSLTEEWRFWCKAHNIVKKSQSPMQ